MVETREEERRTNNVTTDTFIHPPVTTQTPRKKTGVENERQMSLDSLTETIKGLNRLKLDSTINDSIDDHSEKNVA